MGDIITKYEFKTPAKYTYPATIQLDPLKLLLQDLPNQHHIEDFSDATGWGVASTCEFAPAVTGDTFFATLSTGIDADRGGGVLTGTATGGASVVNGWLDLTGGTTQYVDYDANNNTDSAQVGCYRFIIAPAYSGTPASDNYFFNTCKAVGNNENGISLRHVSASGKLSLILVDNAGVTITTTLSTAAFSPVAEQSYEVEINFDLNTGATRMFLDGVQINVTDTQTGTRGTDINLHRVGSLFNGSRDPDFKIKNFIFFDSVQHTANYTPVESLLSGRLQQIRQVDDQATAFANYNTDEDFNWSLSALTGTLFGSASVGSGVLDLTGGGDNGVSYVITGAINAMKGAIRILWTPNYTGNPSSDVQIFMLANSDGSNNNKLILRHDSASAFRMDAWSNGGLALQNVPFGTKTVTAGVPLIVEFNWNFTPSSEEHEVFIDGVQQGGTQSNARTRDNNLSSITHLEIGGVNTDHTIGYAYIAKEPLNTAAHTSPSEPSEFEYLEGTNISPLEIANGSPDGTLQDVTAWTISGCAVVLHYTMMDSTGTIHYWYDHALPGWTLSLGDYATSNIAQDLLDHLASFPWPAAEIQFRYSIVFPDGNTRGCIDNLDIEYTHQIYPTTSPILSIASASRFYSEAISLLEYVASEVGGTVGVIMVVDGVKKYYTSSWVNSNGTLAQSNTLTVAAANIADLLGADVNSQIGMDIFLTSTDGTLSPTVTSVSFTHNKGKEPPSNLPRLIDINMNIYEGISPVEGETVEFRPYKHGFNNPNDGSTGGAFFRYEWADLGGAGNVTLADGFISGQMYLQPTNEFWEFRFLTKRYWATLTDKDTLENGEITFNPIGDIDE